MEILHTKYNKENHMSWRAYLDELREDVHDRNRGTYNINTKLNTIARGP